MSTSTSSTVKAIGEKSSRTRTSTSTSTGTTSRPSLGIISNTRRHSLFGTEDRIVLDLGTRITKIGFSGESRPRLVARTLQLASLNRLSPGYAPISQQQQNDTLWDMDFGKCRDDRERQEKEDLLKARLIHLLREMFSNLLMADPKQRKVILVENALTPTIVKETLCRVLFGNLQVPSVSFIPSPLLCLMAAGNTSGLVLSIGYHETSLTPVFSARPMSHYTRTSSRAAKRLYSRLKALLLTFARFIPPPPSLQTKPSSAKERACPVPKELLTNDFLEEIVAKCCFVSHLTQNGKKGSDESKFSSQSSSTWNYAQSADIELAKMDQDGTIDLEAMDSLKARYSSQSSATNFTMIVPKPESAHLPQSQASTSGSRIGSSLSQQQNLSSERGIIAIPGWIRECAFEVLFEEGDEDECSIIELVLDSILALPVDVRRIMIENILVSGGLAASPGFCNRVRQELIKSVDAIDLEAAGAQVSVVMSSGRRLVIRHAPKEIFSDAPPVDSEVESEEAVGDGDESFTSTQSEVKPSVPPTPSKRKAKSPLATPSSSFKNALHYAPLKPLIPHLAVLNDHAPKLYDDLSAQGGRTPAISPFILGWTGGSLVGSLRTSALEELTREQWDESEAALKGKKKKVVDRPVYGGGTGSLLGGITGGLDTGAFGAISRMINRGGRPPESLRSP